MFHLDATLLFHSISVLVRHMKLSSHFRKLQAVWLPFQIDLHISTHNEVMSVAVQLRNIVYVKFSAGGAERDAHLTAHVLQLKENRYIISHKWYSKLFNSELQV